MQAGAEGAGRNSRAKDMKRASEVVITGMGVVSPIGSGLESFWESLVARRSGVGLSQAYGVDDCRGMPGLPYPLTAEIPDFDTARIKKYKDARRNLKVMTRDIQLGFVASDFAREASQLEEKPVDPERQGILYGALMITVMLEELVELFTQSLDESGGFEMRKLGDGFNLVYPLWMLKYLPNMTACHVGITYDLRGPSNTLVNGEAAGIAALLEGTRVILRGQADVMYAGGTSCCAYPTSWKRYEVYGLSQHVQYPAGAVRPFDARRDGVVLGEGAATCVLESRESAEARGVKIYGKILGWGESAEKVWNHADGMQTQQAPVVLRAEAFTGTCIENAIRVAVECAGVAKEDLAFVMACGYGSVHGDKAEAKAIHHVLGDVPVTAIKGYTGHAMAGSGMMEVVAALLALEKGVIPPALNCDAVAAECPVNVVTEDGRSTGGKKAALVVNYNFYGQASAVVVAVE